jgi:hypothetical protein
MDKTGISFRPSMLGHELADAIKSLDRGLENYAQDVSLDNGEFVVHLRKPTLGEKLKMALMPAAMKAERMSVLLEVIKGAAEVAGVNGDRLLTAIRTGRSAQAASAIRDAGVRVALQNSLKNDFPV